MKKLLLLTSLIAMLLAFTACGGGNKAPEGKTELVVAQAADPKSLDPHASNDNPSARITSQIYNALVELDDNMEVQPQLAESWEQPDAKTIVFKLKQGVKFHNGEELKASDVKFSLERALKSPLVEHIVGMINTVDVIDDYTVKVTTKEEFAPMLAHLAHPASFILNEKAVTEAGDSYASKPVGTGPFKFVSYAAGDNVTLAANEEYFAGAPAMKTLVIKNIVENSSRAMGLEAGEIDIAYDLDPMDADKVKNDANLNLVEEDSLSNDYIGFNIEKEPFNNPKVRQAIYHAINRDQLIEAVYQGAGLAANSPIGPKVFGYSDTAKNYEYNPELAKKLLAEAGYANGFKTTLWTNDNPIRVQIAQIVQAELKQVGIDMAVEPVEWGAYLDGTARGEHEMFILGWVTITADADYGLYPLFHSSNKGGAGNRSFYANPAVDKALDEARAKTDPAEREAAYKVAQELVQEDAPIMSLFYKKFNAGTQNYIEGFKVNPAGHHKLAPVKIKTEAK